MGGILTAPEASGQDLDLAISAPTSRRIPMTPSLQNQHISELSRPRSKRTTSETRHLRVTREYVPTFELAAALCKLRSVYSVITPSLRSARWMELRFRRGEAVELDVVVGILTFFKRSSLRGRIGVSRCTFYEQGEVA